MKRVLLLAAAVLVFIAGAMMCSGHSHAQVVSVERTPQESETVIILYGRACRGASDQEWLAICAAAVVQAQKELEARKPKEPKPKVP